MSGASSTLLSDILVCFCQLFCRTQFIKGMRRPLVPYASVLVHISSQHFCLLPFAFYIFIFVVFQQTGKVAGVTAVLLAGPESIATLPPFGPIEGHKWFDQISSQLESQQNRFALISFGKIQFLPPCIWNLPFMSYRLRQLTNGRKQLIYCTVW